HAGGVRCERDRRVGGAFVGELSGVAAVALSGEAGAGARSWICVFVGGTVRPGGRVDRVQPVGFGWCGPRATLWQHAGDGADEDPGKAEGGQSNCQRTAEPVTGGPERAEDAPEQVWPETLGVL